MRRDQEGGGGGSAWGEGWLVGVRYGKDGREEAYPLSS